MDAETVIESCSIGTAIPLVFAVIYGIVWIGYMLYALMEEKIQFLLGPVPLVLAYASILVYQHWFAPNSKLERHARKLDRINDKIIRKVELRRKLESLQNDIRRKEDVLHQKAIDYPEEYLQYAKIKFKGEMK